MRFDFVDRLDAALFQIIADRVGVVALIAQELLRLRLAEFHQRIVAFDLMRLAAGHPENEGRPLASVRRWILVEKPPRERPSAS